MIENAKDFARTLREADQCSNAGQAASPVKASIKAPLEAVRDRIARRLAAQRDYHHDAYLKFAHLGNLVFESASMSPYSREALLNLLEATLAHI